MSHHHFGQTISQLKTQWKQQIEYISHSIAFLNEMKSVTLIPGAWISLPCHVPYRSHRVNVITSPAIIVNSIGISQLGLIAAFDNNSFITRRLRALLKPAQLPCTLQLQAVGVRPGLLRCSSAAVDLRPQVTRSLCWQLRSLGPCPCSIPPGI